MRERKCNATSLKVREAGTTHQKKYVADFRATELAFLIIVWCIDQALNPIQHFCWAAYANLLQALDFISLDCTSSSSSLLFVC